MDVHLRVTDTPDESSFADLVSGDNVLSIPLFQRPYRWNNKHLMPLLDDIQAVRDEVSNSAFLGVIVSYSRGTGPGRPVTWEIVDGQQRVTTLYLSVMVAAEVAARRENIEWAADVIGTYLLVRPLASNPVNTKLVPSYADRAQFATLWQRLVDIPGLKNHKSLSYNPPMPPTASGSSTGEMVAQYERIRRLLTKLHVDEGQAALESFINVITRHLSFVSISLRDPAVAPKIFERLNARAEPVTIADLVRNEIFSRSGEDAIHAQHVFNTYWEPFSQAFKSANTDLEKFLFPYGLTGNPNVKKADLFPQLRANWGQLDSPQDIIADLDRYKGTFLALETGKADDNLPAALNVRLKRIHSVGRPSSTYSFIMQLMEAFRTEHVSENTAVDILDALESFLFRRAVMGIEPTGLHAAFKGLWAELTSDTGLATLTAEAFRGRLAGKATITWPTDEQFSAAIHTEALYRRKVCGYALSEHERSLKGETASDASHTEHVAPQAPTDHWREQLGEHYERLVHTWGNLIPLSEQMNPTVGQKPFAQKRESFALSKFANARQVAANYSDWTAATIQKRNEEIAAWAVIRWPY